MKAFLEKIEDFLELGGTRKEIVFLVLSGVAVLCSLFGVRPCGVEPAWVAIVLCGVPIVLEAFVGLAGSFDIKADVLVAMALIASLCIGEYFAAGEVAFIMQLGEFLEDLTVARARAGIEKLVRLTPQTARVLRDGVEEIVPAGQVRAGDRIRVLPGESVPVDGVIVSGQTSIDQSVMTGESMPVDKTVGDDVSSGTVNQFGAFEMDAVKVGEDSSIQRMVRLVQSADAGKAKIVGIADRWATWIVVVALASAGVTWLVTGEAIRAVTILVVFCPCALVLATPTAIMAAIGNATRHGFLVREGDALERLSQVKVVAFDKTGTLTYGAPEVVGVGSVSDALSGEELYRLAASAEQFSEHPLGKAVVKGCRKDGAEPLPAEEFEMLPGRGVCAIVDGHRVCAGNPELLRERGVEMAPPEAAGRFLDEGCTVTYVSVDGKFAGFLALSDTLRRESFSTIACLSGLHVTPALLTGDHENAAKAIAGRLKIQEVKADCLPEDKLAAIDEYQRGHKPVCMIGDGINDAPALKKANVGIAMGGVGSDIAVDAADIALVNDDVKELPHLIALSRRMMTTIKLNMCFSMGVNFVAIILAALGTLNPVVGALVHNGGSFLVILNSALLLQWRYNRLC